jgi:hypothetical protein
LCWRAQPSAINTFCDRYAAQTTTRAQRAREHSFPQHWPLCHLKLHYFEFEFEFDHHLIKIGDECERLVIASPVMKNSRGRPSWWRSNYPENGHVKLPIRETERRR